MPPEALDPEGSPSGPSRRALAFAGFTLDPSRASLQRGGLEIRIRPQTLQVLELLARNAGRLVTKEEMLAAVWKGMHVTDDSLVQCVSELREALGDERHALIRTLPRRGYLLAAAVEQVATPPGLAGRDGPRARVRFGRGVSIAIAAVGLAGLALGWAVMLPARGTSARPPPGGLSTPEAEALHRPELGRWTGADERSLRDAVDRLERAAELDPGYAPTYAELAGALGFLGLYGPADPRAAFQRAETSAVRALALDRGLPGAHAALAFVRAFRDHDWRAAERGYRRAMELAGGETAAHRGLALVRAAQGRLDEAIDESLRAIDSDPLSLVAREELGRQYYYARRYGDAVRLLESTLEVDPWLARAHLDLGRAYLQQGATALAVAELSRAVESSNGSSLALAELAGAYAAAGDVASARKLLAKLEAWGHCAYVSPYNFAVVKAALGDRKGAVAALEDAYRHRVGWVAFLGQEPEFDSLRGDARFAELVRKIATGEPGGPSGNARATLFENEHLRLTTLDLGPGETAPRERRERDRAFVVLGGADVLSEARRGAAVHLRMEPGMVQRPRRDPAPFRLTNVGTTPYRIMSLELLDPRPSGFAPSTRPDLPGYSLVLDDERIRAWRIVLSPGQAGPKVAGAAPGVRVFLSGGWIAESADDRPESVSELRPGGFEWLERGASRTLRNPGPTRVELVEFELK